MNLKDQTLSRNFRELLGRGEIPLGQSVFPVNVRRDDLLKAVSNYLNGKPREWNADNHQWNKDQLDIDILWYPSQPVFLTFRNGDLVLIEFSGSSEGLSKWDYLLEVQKYFRIKKDVIKHLGEETRSNEFDRQNMEAAWEFAKLTLYVACDARTGGCGIGLRVLERANEV
jgi:hypothetical protein